MRRSTFHQRSVTYLVKYLYKKYEKKFIIEMHSKNRGNRVIEFAF